MSTGTWSFELQAAAVDDQHAALARWCARSESGRRRRAPRRRSCRAGRDAPGRRSRRGAGGAPGGDRCPATAPSTNSTLSAMSNVPAPATRSDSSASASASGSVTARSGGAGGGGGDAGALGRRQSAYVGHRAAEEIVVALGRRRRGSGRLGRRCGGSARRRRRAPLQLFEGLVMKLGGWRVRSR